MSTTQNNFSLRVILVIAVHVAIFVMSRSFEAFAQERLPREYQLKAALLPKFLDFVDGHEAQLENNQICIVGTNPFGSLLQELLRRQKSERDYRIREITDRISPEGCALIYISISEKDRLREHLESLSGSSAVTVSDIHEFVESGGMIELVVESPYISFYINKKSASKNGVRFSSQLLALAKRVIG